MRHSSLIRLAALAACALWASPAEAQGGPERTCTADDIRQALAGDYAGPPCRFTEMPAGLDAPAPTTSLALAGAQPNRPHAAGTAPLQPQVRQPAPAPTRQSPRSVRPVTTAPLPVSGGEPVRLSDDFFAGNLVGGVGREPAIQYGYRGIIAIDAAGRASVLAPGQVPVSPILRMQARGALRTQLVGQ